MSSILFRIRELSPTAYAVDRRSDFKCIGMVKSQNVQSMSGKHVRKWFAYPLGDVSTGEKFDTPTSAAMAVWTLNEPIPTNSGRR